METMFETERLKIRKFRDGENPEDYVFIQSLVTDNPELMKKNPDYLEQPVSAPVPVDVD